VTDVRDMGQEESESVQKIKKRKDEGEGVDDKGGQKKEKKVRKKNPVWG